MWISVLLVTGTLVLAALCVALLAWVGALLREALRLRAQERMLRKENADLRERLRLQNEVLHSALCGCEERLRNV
jgi:hypothetical protein